MRRIANALGPGILVLLGSLLVGRAAASAERPSQGELPPGFEEALAQREYEASANARGLQAPNRAHNLRTYFEPGGIRVHDRTAQGSPELLALTLAGVGRGDALAHVAPGEVSHAGARVEIRRPGLVEWYVNAPEGLEQGFTLAKQPAGEGPLVLDLALRGATAAPQGDGLVFATCAGRRLRYANLVVSDASARTLAAHLSAPSLERVRIVVEDAGAVYPLVIDPLLTQTADTQLESDQDSANFGFSVSGAGDVNGDGYADVIVGAYQYDAGLADEGAAFVFLGSAAGIASAGAAAAAAQLESDQFSANMGSSVASAGDVNGDGYSDVIVGARSYALPSEQPAGAAFVFHGSASGIADGSPATAATTLGSTQYSGFFGDAVASAGDVNGDGYADVIVGARFYDSFELDEGAAFVFHGSAAGVASGGPATAAAQLESNQGGAHLGFSVASAGDVNGDGYADVIVGSNAYDAGQLDEGAAVVFHGSATGVASGSPATAATQLEGNQGDANLGEGVASAGDVNGDGYADVIVGAPGYTAGETGEGAAFVFHGGATGIASGSPATAATQLESNQPSPGLLGSDFGRFVAGVGDVDGDGYADVIVGASSYDAGQGAGEGAAFVFRGSPSGIASGGPTAALAQLEGDQTGAIFGYGVAGAGDVNGDGYADVIVGAPYYDAGLADEGAAFIYHGGAQGIVDGSVASAAATFEGNQGNAQLGWSVASAGDVNGDGYSDVIVGAPQYDFGHPDEGMAFIFLGSSAGIANGSPATAATQLQPDQNGAGFGWDVASAGDVNGDGYGDVIVGAWAYEAGEVQEGAAFVFLGSPSGIANGNPTTANARLESNQETAHMGWSVAPAGDVNGDAYADVIVGANAYSNGQAGEGAAFVFLGSASGIGNGDPTTANAQLEANQDSAEMGTSVASAGDVNGDGYADVIVGAREYDDGQTDEGGAFVFLGSGSGIASGNPATAATRLESDLENVDFGYSVATAGDVNGDGFSDVIVGSYRYAAGQSSEGAAFVFHGSATGIADGSPANAATQLESDLAFALFGVSVASAGDVNGDGYADVIVGANEYTGTGAAFVFHGSATGIADGSPANAAAELNPADTTSEDFGYSVASAGDVNGDGFADVIVGNLRADLGSADEGAAHLFYGNGNRTGRPVLARQTDTSNVESLVQPWGSSGHPYFIHVAMEPWHPAGRGQAGLEVQFCPAGSDFGDPLCTAPAPVWADSSSPPGAFAVFATGLTDDTLYRWRARFLHAPLSAIQTNLPPKPAHGPWRRLHAQSFEADIRTPLDPDKDGDGLLDVYETNTGVYVSPTDTGTSPGDPDSDDDGLPDGPEVALGTNPNDPDYDDDGDLDGADNCLFTANPDQSQGDVLWPGDACQCGDVTGEGPLDATDYQRYREHVVGRTLSGPFDPQRCDLTGDSACDVADLAVLERLVGFASSEQPLPPPPPLVFTHCDVYGGP